MRRFQPKEPVSTEIIPGQRYTGRDLDLIADEILRQDVRSEICRTCGERGTKTGVMRQEEQAAIDSEGTRLVLEFEQVSCEGGHEWWQGEGEPRGIGGDNPILFEEHMLSRKKREIYCTVGTPDPSIVQGMYNKSHPQGRKINSPEARSKHGASYYA